MAGFMPETISHRRSSRIAMGVVRSEKRRHFTQFPSADDVAAHFPPRS
jgi:hypothetical protein